MSRMSSKKGGQRQSGNPAKRTGNTATTPAGGPYSARQKFEQRSAPAILMLSRLPRWAFPILMALVLVAGLMIPNQIIGGILLLILVGFLAWLTALSWPMLTTSGRILRVITILAALAVAYARFTGSFKS